jgi:FkbM family methyltransferase
MKKFFRLAGEAFFVLFAFESPLAYYRERLHRSRGEKITLALRGGPRYSLHANTNEVRMVNEIWNMKVYDPLLDRVHDGSTVIDIGANVGIFTVKAACAAKDVRVYSYEPFPASFAALKENIRLNKLEKNVTAFNKAVAGKKGELELFFRPHDPGGVSLHQFGDKSELSSIKVPAITLEEVFRENNIGTCDYLKMDCEGAEEQIILNTPRALFERIRGITFEWHAMLNKMTVDEFMAYLHELGYETRYNEATATLYAWQP